MNVTQIIPDIAPVENERPVISAIPTAPTASVAADHPGSAGGALGIVFSGLVEGIGKASTALESAQHAENNFVAGKGGLQEMIYERARADALLSVASSASQKTTQAVSTILNMQI